MKRELNCYNLESRYCQLIDPLKKMQPVQYPSVYRGEIIDREDPLKLGRCKVLAYQVYHKIGKENLPWAWPMFPSSIQAGFFHIPPVGGTVWVMFEMGDPDHPVWANGWWGAPNGANETPWEAFDGIKPNTHVWKSPAGHMVALDDRDGKQCLIIRDMNGNIIKLNSAEKKLEVFMDGDIDAVATGKGSVVVGGDLEVSAGGNVAVSAGGSADVNAAGNASISAGGNLGAMANGDVNVSAGGNLGANAGANAGVAVRGMLNATVYGMAQVQCFGIIMVRAPMIMLN